MATVADKLDIIENNIMSGLKDLHNYIKTDKWEF